jgi:hypothetical protein
MLDSKREEGSLGSVRFLAAFGVGDQVRTPMLFGSPDSLAALEIGCLTDPDVGDVFTVRRGTGAASVDKRGLQIVAQPRGKFER